VKFDRSAGSKLGAVPKAFSINFDISQLLETDNRYCTMFPVIPMRDQMWNSAEDG
jgi:hypothetical protein